MENKLDDFFKNKLEEKEIFFNEEHWKQAQFMLDQQDDLDRQRARWRRYWIIGLCCGGLVMMVSLWLMRSEKNLVHASDDSQVDMENKPMDKIDSLYNVKTKSNNKIPTIAREEKEEGHHNTLPSASTKNSQNSANRQGNENQKNTTKNDTQNLQKIVHKAMKSIQHPLSESTTTLIPNFSEQTKPSNQRSSRGLDKDDLTNNVIEENVVQEATTVLVITEGEQSSEGENVDTFSLSQVLHVPPTPSKNKDEMEQQDVVKNNSHLENLSLLQTSFNLLEIPNPQLLEAVPIVMESKTIEPANSKTWRLGLTASVLLYPFSNHAEWQFSPSQEVHPVVKTQQVNGFKIGMTADYRFRQPWALSGELLYFQQTGTFQSVRTSQQIQYRFGAEVTTFDLVPQSLHYIEIPLLGIRYWNKNALELGVSADFLLGVKNVFGTYQQAFEEIPILENPTTTWKYQDGFSKQHFRLLFGYKYQIFNNLNVGIRMNYTIGRGVLTNDNINLVNRFIWLENRPINMELKMAYKF